MSGKKGIHSTLLTAVPASYQPDYGSALDGRSRIAKIVRTRLSTLIADLGGVEGLSYLEQSLAHRLIWLEAKIEAFETSLAQGTEIPVTEYLSALNVLAGLCTRLGIRRRAKPIPDLKDYLAHRYGKPPEGVQEAAQ